MTVPRTESQQGRFESSSASYIGRLIEYNSEDENRNYHDIGIIIDANEQYFYIHWFLDFDYPFKDSDRLRHINFKCVHKEYHVI